MTPTSRHEIRCPDCHKLYAKEVEDGWIWEKINGVSRYFKPEGGRYGVVCKYPCKHAAVWLVSELKWETTVTARIGRF